MPFSAWALSAWPRPASANQCELLFHFPKHLGCQGSWVANLNQRVMNTRVLLVDDHTMFREALHLMLDGEPQIDVVGEVGDGSLVGAAVAGLAPDVVVMDVSMPTVDGINATRQLHVNFPDVRVVALSAFNHQQFVLEMLEAGAIAFVGKSAAAHQLVQAIASAAEGKAYLCPESAKILVDTIRRNDPGTTQSPGDKRLCGRESQVLRLLAGGKSSPQIGESLHISPSTVDVHRRNIMKKLELHSVAELTQYAIRIGLTAL